MLTTYPMCDPIPTVSSWSVCHLPEFAGVFTGHNFKNVEDCLKWIGLMR